MGLISDRKAKKQREKEKELEKLKNAQNRALSPLKKGSGPGGGVMVGRYPAGYYTTPAPQSSSWSHAHGQVHPSQPCPQANVNPRYQTWVAPRKQQPHLNQLVSGFVVDKLTTCRCRHVSLALISHMESDGITVTLAMSLMSLKD